MSGGIGGVGRGRGVEDVAGTDAAPGGGLSAGGAPGAAGWSATRMNASASMRELAVRARLLEGDAGVAAAISFPASVGVLEVPEVAESPILSPAAIAKGLVSKDVAEQTLAMHALQDLAERDPKAAREAFVAFKELVTRFPKSRYAPDAVARMNYLLNALASHEIHVARYYMKRSAYVAAANRAQYALKAYPQAPANEEGLVILVKAYDALGMNDLRDDAERVLNKNFPDSVYLKGGPKSKAPWWQIWNW